MEARNPSPVRSLVWYFVITFAFSWLFWLAPVLSSRGIISDALSPTPWVILGAHGPLFAALVLTYRSGGWTAVRQLIFGLHLRLGLSWWLAIILLPIALAGIAVWINMLQTGFQPDTTLLRQPWLILPTFLFMFFFGGSVQEEFGWRGYALPRLLSLWNALIAALILGFLWGVWHLPLFLVSGVSQSFMPFGIFLVLTVAFSVLFTWLFLKTNQNVFSALLLHTAINTSLSVFPPIELRSGGNQLALTYLLILYLIVVVLLIVREPSFWLRK